MLFPRAIRSRLFELAALAARELDRSPPDAPAAVAAGASPPRDGETADHLRRAIAALQSRDKTRPDPRVFAELRLMLNKLESGRLPRKMSGELVAARVVCEPKKPQRSAVRRLFGRGARLLVEMTKPGSLESKPGRRWISSRL